MSTLPVFVGLDYHQSTVQVCVVDAAGKVLLNRACENRWQTLRDAVLATPSLGGEPKVGSGVTGPIAIVAVALAGIQVVPSHQ